MEAAERPLGDHPDDNTERDRVGLSLTELAEEADEDALRRLVTRLARTEPKETAISDRSEVASEEELMVSLLEQSLILRIAGIVHRRQSLRGHLRILRS